MNTLNPVHIIGRACRLPGAASVRDFWTLLSEGRCAVTQVGNDRFSTFRFHHEKPGRSGKAYTFSAGTLDDIWQFDPAVFGITPREATQMDPQQRLLLTLVWEALEDAGLPASDIAGQQVGVYVGNSGADHSNRFFFDPSSSDTFMMTGNTTSLVSNRISYIYDLHGPSFTVDTACSSSLVALDLAVKALQAGEVDTAIVAGVNLLLSPFPFVGFSAASMLSPDGLCKPFDESANGYVRAEGGVVLVLQNDKAFKADQQTSFGQIVATGVNSDGRTSGVALPSAYYQAQLLEKLYGEAGIDPNHLAFIEAHGTGTRVGDPAETHALGTVLGQKRDKPLPIGSVKSNIGHLEPASGLASVLKASLALEKGQLPASLHIKKPNPDIAFDDLNLSLNTQNSDLSGEEAIRYAGVNNFGFGGTNAHVILAASDHAQEIQDDTATEPSASIETDSKTDEVCLLLSAKQEAALVDLAQEMAELLSNDAETPIEQWASELAWHRQWHSERLAICGKSSNELVERLQAFAAEDASHGCVYGQVLKTEQAPILVFSGNGSQWAGMGQGALKNSPAFAKYFRQVDQLFQPLAGWSLEEMLLSEDLKESLKQTSIAQPLLFALQVAISQSLKDFSIPIGGVVGHSVGEVAGAWAAGILTLEQAVKVIFARSHHQEATRGNGRMAVVKMAAETVQEVIEEQGFEGIEVSAINSASSITISGPEASLDAFLSYAKSRRWPSKALDIDYPFHSRAIDPIKDGLLADLKDLRPVEQAYPFYSSVSGDLEQGTGLDATYWWDNIRQPVHFHQAMQAAFRDGHRLFVEIGPKSILKGYLAEIARDEAAGHVTILESLGINDASNVDPVHALVARLIANGAEVDRATMFGPRQKLSLPLPNYPWETKEFRIAESEDVLEFISTRQPPHPLLGQQVRKGDWIWDSDLDAHSLPYLQDHKVDGKIILPGAAFAEMALAAGQQWLGTKRIELRDMDLVQALQLSDDHLMKVRTRIDIDAQVVEILSRQHLANEDWQLHAKCRIAAIPGDLDAAELLGDVQAPDEQMRSEPDQIARLYEIAKGYGLDFGPTFRRMLACQGTSDDQLEIILSERELPTSERERGSSGYGLHPLDLDGTFHALNALYERMASSKEKLAYIPVRFGTVRLYQPGTMVRSARLTILRGNSRNISVNIDLFGPDGELVAMVKDGRFRASALVQRLSLERAGYSHSTQRFALPQDHRSGNLNDVFAELDLSITVPEDDRTAIDEGYVLVQTATRRAAYDCLLALVDEAYRLDLKHLPEIELSDPSDLDEDEDGQYARKRELAQHRTQLISSLALICEQSNLAQLQDDVWQLEQDCPLPPLSDLIQLIQAEEPRWIAHTVLLGRAAQIYNQLLPGMTKPQDIETLASLYSNALLEQYESVSPLADCHRAQVMAQLQTILGNWPQGKPLRVLELGAAGGDLTRQLLPMLSALGGQLITADSNKTALERLSIQFASNPAFEILPLEDGAKTLETQPLFDLVVSANHWAVQPWASDCLTQLRSAIRPGGLLLLTLDENNLFHDFVFGLNPSWYQLSLDPHLPVGLGGSAKGWQSHLQELGFIDCMAHAFQGSSGDADLSGAYYIAARQASQLQATQQDLLHEGEDQQISSNATEPCIALFNSIVPAEKALCEALQEQASWSDDWPILTDWKASNLTQLDQHLVDCEARLVGGQKINILFAAGCYGWKGNGHQDDSSFSADRLADLRDLLAQISGRPVRLILLAPGGAPIENEAHCASPINAGLWAFGRTAMNEYGEIDVRLIDMDDGLSHEDLCQSLLSWLDEPGDEREIILEQHGLLAIRAQRGIAADSAQTHVQASNETSNTLVQDLVKLTLPQTGALDRMRWTRQSLQVPKDDEIQIEVVATGLNFRDVMWAQGLLPEEALEDGFAGPTLGFECAGRISALGRNVTGFAIGDPVMALAPDCFASHVTVGQFGVSKLPNGMDLTAAASIPVAFLTAYYALHSLAQLEDDEWVLIHGAAGAVGLAAMQIAKWKGARVIATAGSEEKRQFLKHMGADHVFNTRSLDFVDQVRALTTRERGADQAGIDVVLNSLFGEAMERSLELLRPFGRFLELGKRDFYGNTKIGLRPFRKNISYFGIDADQLLSQQPKKAQRLFADLSHLFESEQFDLLPYRLFEPAEVLDAFRLMQQSGHIGKIVVRAPHVSLVKQKESNEIFAADPEGHHVIIGGLGGFGLEAASWLADHGAKSLVLVGRSGNISQQAEAVLARLKRMQVNVEIAQCDVTNEAELGALLDRLRKSAPIKGVLHSAMVLEDAFIQNLEDEQIEKVLAPKIKGGAALDLATEADDLDYFVLFSSISVLLGNPGQSHYVTANAYLEGLARQRKARGKPALAVGWGAITDVGILARESDTADLLAKQTGGLEFRARDALDLMGQVLANGTEQKIPASVSLAPMNWSFAKDNLPIMKSPTYAILAKEASSSAGQNQQTIDIRALIEGLSASEAGDVVARLLAEEVASIFRMPVDDVNLKRSLSDIGMDSLMGMELRTAAQQRLELEIPMSAIGDGTSLMDLANSLVERLQDSSNDQTDQEKSSLSAVQEATIHQHMSSQGD